MPSRSRRLPDGDDLPARAAGCDGERRERAGVLHIDLHAGGADLGQAETAADDVGLRDAIVGVEDRALAGRVLGGRWFAFVFLCTSFRFRLVV